MIDHKTNPPFRVYFVNDNPSEFAITLYQNTTFTRSDGTLFSRIYERLTKASRRRIGNRSAELTGYAQMSAQSREQRLEAAYRAGVKDTLEALRTELS